ncbi:hypothetical protein [Flavobacterium sp.]|uniref:hypothetical protein n=1 Tax=Flavobacterium sp. TaxID=239 RepID=UPI0026069523|nr:hypothetical protein [Flavobacterium sp.]
MEAQNNSNKIAGTLFIGCMFIGLGLGTYFDKTSVGILVGMGVGFIASALAKAKI